jgi:hypothetical protein
MTTPGRKGRSARRFPPASGSQLAPSARSSTARAGVRPRVRAARVTIFPDCHSEGACQRATHCCLSANMGAPSNIRPTPRIEPPRQGMSRRTQCAALSVILHGYVFVLLPSHRLAMASTSPQPPALDTVAVDPLPAPAPDPEPPPLSPPLEKPLDAPTMDLVHRSPHPVPGALPGARPPLAARASAVMTQEQPTSPVAEPPTTFVTGLAPSYPGGVTQANAQGTVAQDDPDAREWGEPGGTGVGGGGFGFDLRRPASLGGLKEWHCPFPAEATGIDHTWARIVVFVEADGRPHHVVVQEDPGTGFGREAVTCAMKEHYIPAHNRDGHPTRGRTLPFRVYFDRW